MHDLRGKRLEGEEDDGGEEEGEREKGEERRERGHEGKGTLNGEKERGGMKGGEAPPPRYEDVTTTAADGKAGLKERMGRMGRMGRKEDGVVR